MFSTHTRRLAAGLFALLVADAAQAQVRITEWMYDGAGGEFVELTNVGATPVDMAGWHYDDDSANPAIGFALGGFGVLAVGESAVFAENSAETFRADWNLCDGVKLLGGVTNNLGRGDQINIFDGAGALVDRLTYGDQVFPGTIRTSGASGWVSLAGLGADDVHEWTLSSLGDGEGSLASTGGAIGSPGRSTRATVAHDSCGPAAPSVLPSTIATGSEFACGLDAGGRAYCWGSDANGQLGNGATVTSNMTSPWPVDMTGLPAGTRFASITAGGSSACGLTPEGAAWCWGQDTYGQLGNGAAISGNQPLPVAVDMAPLSGATFVMLSAGRTHVCGVSDAGIGYCWGRDGALGLPADATGNQHSPSPVDMALLPGGATLVSISTALGHSCGLVSDENLYCWGQNNNGVLGIGSSGGSFPITAVDVSGLPAGTRFAAVTTGDSHTCALSTDHVAYCWGSGTNGATGNGQQSLDVLLPNPVVTNTIPAGTHFTVLEGGGTNTCGILDTGAAYCWGFGGWGALGTGDGTSRYSPHPVATTNLPAGTVFTELSADNNLTCAATAVGTFYCWGRDNQGQQGDGAAHTDDPAHFATLVDPFAPAVGLPPTITVADAVVVGSVADPTNLGTVLTIGDPDTDVAGLGVTVTTSNAAVIAPAGVTVSVAGAERTVSFGPIGRGVSNVTFIVTDPDGNSQSATIQYASSLQAPDASGRYHHRISDASAALDVGDGYVLLLNDETNTIFLHRDDASGLPQKTWAFSSSELGTSSEIDFEGIARRGDLVLLTGSHGNNRNGSLRPERRTFVAATISGSGADTELVFRGRYNNLWAELRAWDQSNGHGLGADALGFIAATAGGVLPNAPDGFNIEGLAFSPAGDAVYLGFRAPTIEVDGRYQALIVPLLNVEDIINGTPGAGPAQFGAPVLLDLDGRSIRALSSNEEGDFLISAGPSPQNETWALYTWDGDPAHPTRFNQILPADDGLTGGAWEAIGTVPHPLAAGAATRLITDSGDTNFYGTGATKDLAQPYQKSYSQAFTIAFVPTGADGVRITEWMYSGAGEEFIELTNVGAEPVDVSGWRYDDDSADPAIGFDLGSLGTIAAGESVVLTEGDAEAFRADWGLCGGIRILGGYSNNLGRADQINLFDAAGSLVDRLTYGDEVIPGSIRTNGAGGWVSAVGVGADNVLAWTLSTVADGEGSLAALGGDIGSPGRSTRASVAYTPCLEPASLAITPTSLTATLVAGASETQVLTLANVGEEPLDWQVSEDAAECALPAWISVDPLAGTIAGAAEEALDVRFDSEGLAVGEHLATLCIASNDAAQPVRSVPLSLQLTAPPAPVLSFDPASLEFGEVESGASSAPKAAILRNDGNADASALDFTAPASGFVVDGSGCATDLAAGASCVVIVTFTPATSGSITGELVAGSAEGASAGLALQGTGVAPQDPLTDLAVAIQARKLHVRRGELLDYIVTVSNLGSDAATGASVASTLSAALDEDLATWLCLGPAASGCTAGGEGELADSGLAIAAGGGVSYLVSAPVRADADEAVVTQAHATQEHDTDPGNDTAEATSHVVVYRDGFEPEDDWGSNPPLQPAASMLAPGDVIGLALPARGEALVEKMLVAMTGNAEPATPAFRLERLNAGTSNAVRLVATGDGGEYATRWLALGDDATPTLALVAAQPEGIDGEPDARMSVRLMVADATLELPLLHPASAYRIATVASVVPGSSGQGG